MAARIIAPLIRKGGTGKTTTTIQLAHIVSLAGCKVLVIDLDPQGNTTMMFMDDMEYDDIDFYHLLCTKIEDKSFLYDNCICESAYDNIDCIPSNASLDGLLDDLYELSKVDSLYLTYLKQNLSLIADDYDFIIFDTNASNSRINKAAICACNSTGGVICPIEVDFYSHLGVADLLDTVFELQQQFGLDIRFMGMFFIGASKNTNHFKNTYSFYQSQYSDYFIPIYVRHSDFLKRLTTENVPILLADKRHGTADDYINLVRYLNILNTEQNRTLERFLRKRRSNISTTKNEDVPEDTSS